MELELEQRYHGVAVSKITFYVSNILYVER